MKVSHLNYSSPLLLPQNKELKNMYKRGFY